MSLSFLVALLLLFSCSSLVLAHSSGSADADTLTESAVIEFINNYGTDLNELAEYSLGASCGLDTVQSAALLADSTTFVQTYFSQSIQQYLVVQDTHGFAPVTVLNASVGGAAQPASGIPAIPNSAALYAWLPSGYAGFFNYFFSRPFWWTIDKVIVDSINVRDHNYGGRTTAYVRASDVNEGFKCTTLGSPSGRIYGKQQSVYHHVLVLEDVDANTPGFTGRGKSNGSAWRFLVFEETNKNSVTFAQLPIQTAPAN
jgi:hypothetical protein